MCRKSIMGEVDILFPGERTGYSAIGVKSGVTTDGGAAAGGSSMQSVCNGAMVLQSRPGLRVTNFPVVRFFFCSIREQKSPNCVWKGFIVRRLGIKSLN